MAGKTIIEIPDFNGFSPEALKFLRALKRNNRRDWFQPRKPDFDRLLKYPMMAVVAELSVLCRKTAPELRFVPENAVLRIYRDTRFSKDKTPYKNFVAASIPFGNLKKDVGSIGVYFHIEPGHVFVFAGLYKPTPPVLRKVRESLKNSSESLIEILTDKKFKQHFGELRGEKLKIAPRGVHPDHPMFEYLRFKQFYVEKKFEDRIALRKDFPKIVAKEFEIAMPLLRWLNRAQRAW